ncbi:MAG: hypothetical protein ACI9VS_000669 [Candidatus Binatia bacterium]|jgi:hypothetical protein
MPPETHHLTCEVLVAGGGPAGVPCALAAARCGAKVILCQDRPVLGGNASSEVRMHIVGANGTGGFDRGEELTTEAREGGIIEEIRLENCVRNPQRSASMFDLILYEKCMAEANLTLMLNTTVTGVKKTGARISHAIADRQSTEDRFIIQGDVFVDCTGDGRLGFEAGAAFMEGRESKEQFNESLARDEHDNQRLGSTILIQARKHDRPMPFVAPDYARKFTKASLMLRLYSTPGHEEPTHEYGYWWAEWGGDRDTIKDNEEIRDELLSIVMGIWDHVKNGPPEISAEHDPFDAAHWALDWFGFLPGKRESRRFIGQHVLTEQDIMESREFPDAIAYGGWSIDLHPPRGVDAPTEEPCVQHPVPWLYDIPLRCCVSRDIENLMFAGRNMSASHVAFASTRVMATCAVVGQGVGTAASYAAIRKISPSALLSNSRAIPRIQQSLLRQDAYLIGIVNNENKDLARRANVTASSSQPGGEPINIFSGQTRSAHGKRGAPPERQNPGTHRWMSDPAEGLPAWIELKWEAPIELSFVRIVFDTGMHRHLTLSHHDGYTSKMKWGAPQPETVSDYEIEGLVDNAWRIVKQQRGNSQRARIHRLIMPVSITALRITVRKTNGIDHARIFEVRVFAA